MNEKDQELKGRAISELLIELETAFHEGKVRGVHIITFDTDEGANFKHFGANAFELMGALDTAKMTILMALRGTDR